MTERAGPLWIFGYGSLIWRPDFPHGERVVAELSGYERRFWQGSTDHRGVPGAPGRVVTLVEAAGSSCWGVAYRIEDADAASVLSHLDHREKGGYERREVTLRRRDGVAFAALVYLATPANDEYLGPAPLPEIAGQIRRSAGPSGPNLEYLLRLAEAIRALGATDPHVFSLEMLARDS